MYGRIGSNTLRPVHRLESYTSQTWLQDVVSLCTELVESATDLKPSLTESANFEGHTYPHPQALKTLDFGV